MLTYVPPPAVHPAVWIGIGVIVLVALFVGYIAHEDREGYILT